MDLDLDPPLSAAGVRLGATREEARRQCLLLGDPTEFRRTRYSAPALAVSRPSGLSIFIYFDHSGRVEAIEFGRPLDREDIVRVRGLDIFGRTADDLTESLRRHGEVRIEDNGCSVIAPNLLLALWRPVAPEGPEDEDGRYFESVLVARPGYYG